MNVSQCAKTALCHVACASGTGVSLARIPIAWLGARLRELIATPAMRALRLRVGVIALGMLQEVEFARVQWLKKLSMQAIAGRDPVVATAYALSLIAFALMPASLKHDKSG